MTRPAVRRSAWLLCAVAVAVGLAGCQAKAELTSSWPIATMERRVPQPPIPPRWPLTGLNAPSDSAVHRRVISVKIENSPEARPQTGLNEADVVYETLTEGGISRFNALYQSTLPKAVGPVRSARLSDLWIVPQYNALFFFSGASTTVNGDVKRAKLSNLSQDIGVSAVYYRSSARAAPHNLYLSVRKAYAEARKRHYGITSDVPAFRFDRGSSTDGQKAVGAYVPLSTANTVRWTYNAASRMYLRSNNGRKQKDALTGKPVAARNVVMLWARYRPVSHDKVGSTTYDVNLSGSGRMALLRAGQVFTGTWNAGRDAPPTFVDAQGNQLKLTPGNTWFEIVPLDVNVTLN